MDFSPAALAFGVLFGPIGLAMVQIGRKRALYRMIFAGLALMGSTFVSSGEWWTWLVALLVVAAGVWK